MHYYTEIIVLSADTVSKKNFHVLGLDRENLLHQIWNISSLIRSNSTFRNTKDNKKDDLCILKNANTVVIKSWNDFQEKIAKKSPETLFLFYLKHVWRVENVFRLVQILSMNGLHYSYLERTPPFSIFQYSRLQVIFKYFKLIIQHHILSYKYRACAPPKVCFSVSKILSLKALRSLNRSAKHIYINASDYDQAFLLNSKEMEKKYNVIDNIPNGDFIDCKPANLTDSETYFEKAMPIRRNVLKMKASIIYTKEHVKPAFKYAVFLDQFVPYHSELQKKYGYHISADKYFQDISNFFSEIKNIFNLDEILVCLHPHADEKIYREKLSNVKLSKGITAQTVKDSEYVLAHYSDSVNYAVIFRKPLIFFLTDEMAIDENFVKYAHKKAKLLGRRVNYIGSNPGIKKNIDFGINEKLYRQYEESILKKNGEKDTWKIVYDYCFQ